MRRKLATALATMGFITVTLTALPSTAQANPEWYAAPSSSVQADPDGKLHVWEHQKKGGKHCAWSGPSDNWDWDGCNGMRNKASSVHNNGRTHDVWLYYGPDQTGAHYCLNKGVYLENIVHHYFPHNGAGGGKSLNDNIASHKWVANC